MRTSSSFLIETGAGDHVAVSPRLGGGVDGYTRAPGDASWTDPQILFGSEFDALGCALIESTFGNLEMIVLEGGVLRHYYHLAGQRWFGAVQLPGTKRVYAGPAFIQSHVGNPGNFEVVAVVEGGLAHWYRDNSSKTWFGPDVFGNGQFSGVSLIQSNYGGGNLELLALQGDQLWHFFRDAASLAWGSVAVPPAGGVVGAPGFIQGSSGGKGNFEVVAPVAGGGLAHYWRDNDAGQTWHGPTWFGEGPAVAAALIQNAAGKLEAMALRADNSMTRYQRDDGGTWLWSATDVAQRLPCDPALAGKAAAPMDLHIVGIHAAALHTAKVLYFAFAAENSMMGVSRVFDPAHGTLTEPAGGGNQFCSGHVFLPDGRLFVAGGHDPEAERRSVHVFDTNLEAWSQEPDMPRGRWYPSCTALPDGRAMVVSGALTAGVPATGAGVNNTLSFYDPTKADPNQRMSPDIPLPSPWASSFAAFGSIDLYPFVFVLPDGKLLVHSRNTSRIYDGSANSWGVEMVSKYSYSRTYPGEGAGVLLPLSPADGYRARVLVLGGGGADPDQLTADTPATATAEILDLGAASPAWRFTQSMKFGRVMVDGVLLPDGTVLAVGGSSSGRNDNTPRPVLTPELFDPATETWTSCCEVRVPRGYHGSAILLADARVALAGKDGSFQADTFQYPEHRVEIFSPPYLFKGPRPALTTLPPEIAYGATFPIGFSSSAGIAKVVLMRPGAVTHQFNMEQRLVVLVHAPASSTSLSATAPPNANLAPPGYYMCFLVDAAGVPSVAGFTHLS